MGDKVKDTEIAFESIIYDTDSKNWPLMQKQNKKKTTLQHINSSETFEDITEKKY